MVLCIRRILDLTKLPIQNPDHADEKMISKKYIGRIAISEVKARALESKKQDLIIMAQQQHAADVHPDELCPPNKRYDLTGCLTKKLISIIVQCSSESKILTNINQESIHYDSAMQLLSSCSMDNNKAQFWHTMKRKKYQRRPRDMYHNLQDDEIMKNIFNSGRQKNKVGMQIPSWMINDEMKVMEHYRMYAKVFGIDVPLTQLQPTETTQGTHRTPSAPRSPNPDKEVAESSALRRSTVIRLRLPKRRSTRLTSPAQVPTVNKADEMILQDTLQVSLAKHKSREEQEARENVALVDEHLASEEIKKMVDGQENIVDDSSIPRNYESNILGTRIEPRSDKESLEVEIAKEKEVEIAKEKEVEISKEKEVELTNVVIPVNVNDEDEEITDEVYELKNG
ncbi:hypothetical protein Tco_0909153 [Tanacetum coccineum]|uniref:Uncharacterized protein n=1 Tax=Tanacetum coccineum TaxID=301880 RepID=A0ABQ5CRB1_9ASTR